MMTLPMSGEGGRSTKKFKKNFPEKPTAAARRWFFYEPKGGSGEKEEEMSIPSIHLTKEERFVALTQVYMELELPLAVAVDAANADLRSLAGGSEVAEAA
jgi:hypothetical protein